MRSPPSTNACWAGRSSKTSRAGCGCAGDLAPSGLSFAHEPDHVPPDCPGGAGDQQMQVHIDIDIDIAVDELAAGGAWAEACGAVAADHQPQPNVRVMLDPAGHPFCLFTGEV